MKNYKEYKVVITTTFKKEIVIKANSKEDAIYMATDCDGTDTTDFETTYEIKEQ